MAVNQLEAAVEVFLKGAGSSTSGSFATEAGNTLKDNGVACDNGTFVPLMKADIQMILQQQGGNNKTQAEAQIDAYCSLPPTPAGQGKQPEKQQSK